MSVQTVAELEKAVLDGMAVEPERLAVAKANEEAAARLAELQAEREEALAREERSRQAAQREADLLPRFTAFIDDTRLVAIKEKIRGLIAEFGEVAIEREASFDAFFREIGELHAFDPSFNWQARIAADGSGELMLGMTRIKPDRGHWEQALARELDVAVQVAGTKG